MNKTAIQVNRILNTVLQEAKWDYTYSSDYAVVNINGSSLILNAEQIILINKFKNKLEEDIKNG